MKQQDIQNFSQKENKGSKLYYLIGIILMVLVLFLFFYKLNDFPSLWWDEGWTLDAARNWVVGGHLGHYLDGEPISPRIPVRFPIVIPIAISMKIFGVGTWQGRLPGALFTIATFGLLFFLANQMYNRKTGLATLFVLLLLSAFNFNPVWMGRQVLAEMPMLFYLCGGYTMLWLSLSRSFLWVGLAVLFFGIAIHAKLQVPPFWAVSMILSIILAVKYRQKRSLKILVGVSLGTIVLSAIILIVQNIVMPGSFSDPELIKLLINSVILVLDWPTRITALNFSILLFLPQGIGYLWASNFILKPLFVNRDHVESDLNSTETNRNILRVAIWGLGVGWFLWYLFMAVFWSRYLFPPYFFGCIFFSAYIDKITSGFNIRILVKRTSNFLLGREFTWVNFQSVILIFLLSVASAFAFKTEQIGLSSPRSNPNLMAKYLQQNIPPGATVETFESELLFLTPEVTFHYPSDLVSMELNRMVAIDPLYVVEYDPLEYQPDYLVRGPMGQMWQLYDPVINDGSYQLVAEMGNYQIYRNQMR